MVRFLLTALLLASLAHADEKWVRIRTGPFEILSSAGASPARDRALEAEQFRHVFAALTGLREPVSIWPLRIVVEKGATPSALALSRDSYISRAAPNAQLAHDWMVSCARVLLDSNVNRMPAGIEDGLIALLSTITIKGTRLTIGTPPPAPERTRDWARLQMLATDPELGGRFRVFLHNLTQGADLDTAYRNSFEKGAAGMEKRVDAYFAAGKFEPAPFDGRALSPDDFTVRDIPADEGSIALADLQSSEQSYKALPPPVRDEGLGWLAERAGQMAAAKPFYETATRTGSTNARAWAGVGTAEALTKAAELNPLWSEPWRRLAALQQDPARKAAALKKAATLARRDAALWAEAAIALQDANQYQDAAKAWTSAQLAATSDAERERLRTQRRDVEAKRAEFEAAERRRAAEEEARELQRLRDKAMSEIHAAESKANAEMQKDGAKPEHVEEWWDDATGPKEKASGKLISVQCLRTGARWVILTDAGKRLTLRVPDPDKIVLAGGGRKTVACGPQKPAPKISIEYAKDELKAVEFP